MNLPDLAVIIAVSVVCAVVVGLLGLVALWLARRSTMLVRLCIVVITSILSVVTGMIAIAQAMYLSQHDLTVSFYVAAAATVSSLGVALVLGRLFARDSRQLRRLAQAIGAGEDVVLQTHPRDNSELTRLATELASTSERLAEARGEVEAIDASRRELVAWISHDLRTPLAGLRAMAEALEDGMTEDPDRFHRQMRSQVDHLSGMVDDLFELSKIHSGTLTLAREKVSLYDLVSDAVADLRFMAESRRVTLREAGGPGISVVGDPRELTRVVENLLTTRSSIPRRAARCSSRPQKTPTATPSSRSRMPVAASRKRTSPRCSERAGAERRHALLSRCSADPPEQDSGSR